MNTLQLGMGYFPDQPGGLNRVVYNLAATLPDAGVGVRCLVAGPDELRGPWAERFTAFAGRDAPLPRRLLAARREVARQLRRAEVDLVSAHFAVYTLPALRLLRDRPLVVHFHGPWASEGGVEGNRGPAQAAKHGVERAVYREAQRLIVLSEAFRDTLVQRYRVAEERIRIVPGGVDVERFSQRSTPHEARARLGLPHDRPIVLSVRRLARRMGLETLLEAVVELRAAVPDVLVLVAGRGPLAAELRARIDALELQRHVRLLGFVPDEALPDFYRAATLSVVPSRSLEGFGLVTLESLAAGTPVLVTPVGGLPETVRDLAPELVLPGSHSRALSEGLAAALRGELPLPSAAACRAHAERTFAWPVIARRVREVYREALR